MVAPSPYKVVEGPGYTPPVHSLLTSGVLVTEADNRWEAGYEFCPEACVEPTGWQSNCQPVDAAAGGTPVSGGDGTADMVAGGYQAKADCPDQPPLEPYLPFIIDTVVCCDDCSGSPAGRDLAGAARRQLEAITPKAFELEVWSGVFSQATGVDQQRLASPDAEIVGVNLPPIRALAALIQAASDCATGGRAMIHVTPEIATVWGDHLIDEGKRLVTKVGRHIVVPGVGYTGFGPAGEVPDPGSSWAYVTGMVQMRLGEVQVLDPAAPPAVVDAQGRVRRGTGLEVRAERAAAANWEPCCHFAAEIDLGAA